MSSTPPRITAIVTRLVQAGHEDSFARWAEAFDTAARASPGVVRTLRLEQPGGLVHFLHDFESREALARWTGSPRYAELKDAADGFSAERVQLIDPGQCEVRLPSDAAVPKWKSWIATWTVVFPLLLALNALVRTFAAGAPQPVQLGATSLVMTATLTWLVLPVIRKRLRPWLFHDKEHGVRKEPG
jgi:hypothetical protein